MLPNAITVNTAPSSALISGPAMAMVSSADGVCASDSISATPPNRNSVIRGTLIP